jgi:replicative superfamily II helicase
MSRQALEFPLFQRAEQLGVLDGQSALIVAPTATGKSHIGITAIQRAIARQKNGPTHAYLVPFRALAAEIYDVLVDILQGTEARVRIATGDYRDPLRPEDADLVVSTYESFASLLRGSAFQPGTVVADEVHLVADDSRGPTVEGLFARLLASGRLQSLCALSAVVENGRELADWLGVQLLQGTVGDRPVALSLQHRFADDLDAALADSLRPCADGEQALVFCSSRGGAEKCARFLADAIEGYLSAADRDRLAKLSERIREEDPAAEDVIDLLPRGVAYHHAGLPKPIRRHIEAAYRDRQIRVITATPTLAAGVNLPAGIVIVRDVLRSEAIRGVFRRVLVPSGEILNMLGRAGRPHQVDRGTGIALIEHRFQREDGIKQLIAALKAGQGGPVASKLGGSFEGLMRFVLAVVAERGETTREDVGATFERTLAHHSKPEPIAFDRPFRDDMMEDLPAYQKVIEARGAIRLASYALSPEGVTAVIVSDDKQYEVILGIGGLGCSCPAFSRFYRGKICKHQACAVHDLLFVETVHPEARARAIYNCGHVFADTLDVGTRLSQALEILAAWRLVERVPGGWRATPVGEVASASGFDLLLVHQAIERVSAIRRASYHDVAGWAVEDFFAEEKDRKKWARAVSDWIGEVDAHRITLPTRYRGDFEERIEDLARVCLLYEKTAFALGKPGVAETARTAAGSLRYGVPPELVLLMALGFPQLARARTRYLFDHGIRNVQDLANADPDTLADPRRAPATLVRDWVERAQEIHRARAVATADRDEADAEFDELVARFRLDPAALN